MKKKLLVIGMLSVMFLLPATAFAAKGSWYSAWGYDINGLSGIGTANASSRAWYQFQVRRAGGSVLVHRTAQIGKNQRYDLTSMSVPLVDKQGIVSVSPGYWHSPYFNS